MSSKWRDTTLMKKVKKENNFVCQECGSTLNIQAHHLYGKQSNELIVLCGNCHAKKHPYLAPALFSAKNIYERQLRFNRDIFKAKRDGWMSRRNFIEFGDFIFFKDTKTFYNVYEYMNKT